MKKYTVQSTQNSTTFYGKNLPEFIVPHYYSLLPINIENIWLLKAAEHSDKKHKKMGLLKKKEERIHSA